MFVYEMNLITSGLAFRVLLDRRKEIRLLFVIHPYPTAVIVRFTNVFINIVKTFTFKLAVSLFAKLLYLQQKDDDHQPYNRSRTLFGC